jgi:sec-independent protein translocase protein TatA
MLRNGLEPWHLLIVAIIIILLFGSRKLPDTARALGKSMRILKSEAKAMKDDGTAQSASAQPASGTASEAQAQHVIQAAPGETASARPVEENNTAH